MLSLNPVPKKSLTAFPSLDLKSYIYGANSTKIIMVQLTFNWFKSKILEGHMGESPETYSKHCFGGVCSDLSYFYSLNHFNYANSEWSKSLPGYFSGKRNE